MHSISEIKLAGQYRYNEEGVHPMEHTQLDKV
jgi:hypothetical protein